MDALFIIPTLISPEVDDRVVPAICKLVERNILLNRESTFRKAAIIRFLGAGKGLAKESSDVLERLETLIYMTEAGGKKDDEEDDKRGNKKDFKKDKNDETALQRVISKRGKSGGSGADIDTRIDISPTTIKADSKEVPKGVSFFSAVSLEPTYLEIVLKGRSSALSDNEVSRVIRIGMKSVPFKLDGVNDLKELLADSKSRSNTMTWFYKYKERLLNNWGWLKGDKPTKIVKKSLTAGELSNPKLLASLLGAGSPREWAPLVIFSYLDFHDAELKDNLWTYDKMVTGGWGNMVIVDDDNQSLYFCMQETKSCYQLSYNYLAKILDMENILVSKGAVSRTSRPMTSSRQTPSSIMGRYSESSTVSSLVDDLNGKKRI
jgi:hypothetical protein